MNARNILPVGFTPLPNDIVCGRGKSFVAHPGNVKFSKEIRNNLTAYKEAARRSDKSRVVEKVVNSLVQNGCRFLKEDSQTKRYFVMDQQQARDKTGHAIRDLLRLISSKGKESVAKRKRKPKGTKKNTTKNKKTDRQTDTESSSTTISRESSPCIEMMRQDLYTTPENSVPMLQSFLRSSSTLPSTLPSREPKLELSDFERVFDLLNTTPSDSNNANGEGRKIEGHDNNRVTCGRKPSLHSMVVTPLPLTEEPKIAGSDIREVFDILGFDESSPDCTFDDIDSFSVSPFSSSDFIIIDASM